MKVRSVVCVVLVICISSALYVLWRNPDGRSQFKSIFGVDPPASVSRIEAKRYFAGGPGDTFVLLRFRADRQAINELANRCKLERDEQIVKDVLAATGDMRTFWRLLFSTYPEYGGKEWRDPEPMAEAEVYRLASHGSAGLYELTLVWDPDSGRVYVLRTRG